MTDPQTDTGAPGSRLPSPTFFDPSFERLPSAAAFDGENPGPVLLLFDPRADRAWVADAAIALATGWNAAGHRTVLADVSIEDPILHERVGVPNLDGVVDLFLYGASLARSARPVPGRGFLLITAGTYTPDPDAILRHPRWEKILAGFREAQAALLLFVPIDAPCLPEISRWAQDVVLLGARDDGELFDALAPAALRLRAWLTPPAGHTPGRAAAGGLPRERFPEPEPAASVQPWKAPPRDPAPRPDDTLPSAEEAVGAPVAALPVPDPQWEASVAPLPPRRRMRTIPKERRLSPLMLVLLVLALMAAAIGAALAYLPGLLPSLRRAPPAAAPRAGARGAPAVAAGVARPYSVFMSAYLDADAARVKAERARAELPGTPVFVVPEDNGGALYFKVYAGMLEDTVEAAALRTQLERLDLVSADAVGGPSALIQPRPWAYELGNFATREEAERRGAELVRAAVNAYPVPVPQSDGSERWSLYVGAFADSTRAQPMRTMLDAAHLPTRLVRRVGRAPATSK